MNDSIVRNKLIARGLAVPAGFRRIELTAFTDGRTVIVPEQDGLELQRDGREDDHDCDFNGCGLEHVVARFPVPGPRPMEGPAGD
jgi:hypothetical protein